ncbi:MAG: aminotransferase class V-fold PLP-dependent enzyme [Chloroflexota bacterium]|nr:aminotransferase class V-fold PLP-dependent enzyme [Dehalococcoidia bacterium]MEC8958821.1 aminotransferase class V-fold PLP-dependent enzyme [Chloroflexota bacterium]MQF66883.1 aminotransferase class V-fold PLP-dependent enzyme [SAR202 cluster bacterium AD-802-F09_MRT_200m]MEC9271785.1 aminotransferase class V-fold PLP-dependent enzyme [Chloroflexota bacterium]MED5405709.1 aminotransferase class V-fold PLP-dependent enzyme [Chloroflexota bacterium]|tara:strand:+ start:3416 stop:4564 length:1149 start_codon:yes stop_codon:yes gene_type:complete
MATTDWGSIYKELGATPVINATGSVTMLGGSTPAPEVKEAMERAEGAYIPLMELEEKAGAAIANMVNVPAAYITSGAGSALTLATAACMAGDDDAKIQQLPDTTGMKNEVLIQERQRYWYDRCLELAGAKLVMFGNAEGTTRKDLEDAIGPNTAAVHYYAVAQEPDRQALSLEDTIEIAHDKGVPVLVDAAGQIYPLDLFGSYVRMGADFQCTAAKYMSSPQSTGLAFGSEDMIRKLALQSFVSYEGRRIRGVGRPQKVDRQEMVGAVAAVRRWMTMNHEERLAETETKCRNMLDPLQGIPGVTVELLDNIIGHQPYGVTLEVDSSVTGISAHDVVDLLKAGDPPIWTRVREGDTGIVLHAFGLNEGEDKIVGQRIAALFGK